MTTNDPIIFLLGRLTEALTPSAETKAAYMGEFEFTIPDGPENRTVTVPWTTIKDIMAAIRTRATEGPVRKSETPTEKPGIGD